MTATYPHGLVIGAFYPLHGGHEHLIDTAAAACERLTVVAMASGVESIPLPVRTGWLRERYAAEPRIRVVDQHDEHPVDLSSEKAWQTHVELIRAAVARMAVADGCPGRAGVDAVFSCEPYGPELARRFGAVAVDVDPGRRTVPVSATAVRADPVATWHTLSPPVRRTLARRVVLVGAESTGTTTLSRDLHATLLGRGGPWAQTRWVPEVGRRWTYDMLAATAAHRLRTGEPSPTMADLLWLEEDFEAIARQQRDLEDEAAAAGGPVLVCDTDAFATDVWFARYLGDDDGGSSAPVRRIADEQPTAALYVLTSHEGVPFDQDGIRDGEHLRAWMTGQFRSRLAERARTTGARVVEVTGTPAERLARAVAAVDGLLRDGWQLADRLPQGGPGC